MNDLTVDMDLCKGCKLCLDACFIELITWDVAEMRPVFASPERCARCMHCEAICPEHAIRVLPDYLSAAYARS